MLSDNLVEHGVEGYLNTIARERGKDMIHWFRHLPYKYMDEAEWPPFIHSTWFREHYMKFVYLLDKFYYIFLGCNKLSINFNQA